MLITRRQKKKHANECIGTSWVSGSDPLISFSWHTLTRRANFCSGWGSVPTRVTIVGEGSHGTTSGPVLLQQVATSCAKTLFPNNPVYTNQAKKARPNITIQVPPHKANVCKRSPTGALLLNCCGWCSVTQTSTNLTPWGCAVPENSRVSEDRLCCCCWSHL